MPIRNCRGSQRKIEIVTRYRLEIGPRCRMLRHQENEGIRQECCRISLKDEFFQFFYEPKEDAKFDYEYPRESGSFFVGRHCGMEFITLLQKTDPTIKEPELFDPLRRRREEGGRRRGNGGGGRDGSGGGIEAPTPLNQEVTVVLQLLATVCRTPLRARMNGMLRWLREHPDQDTQDWTVTDVNNAIREHPEFMGRTLRDMIEAEAEYGGDEWRDFEFHHIESILRDRGQPSYVDPAAIIPADMTLRRPAEVIRLGDRSHRLRLQDDGSQAILFGDCPGMAAITDLGTGDLLLVRVARNPKGLRIVQVYERVEKADVGEISYVDPDGRFAFLRLDEGGSNVFIPGRIYADLGAPSVRARVAVRTIPTERQPQATWAAMILQP